MNVDVVLLPDHREAYVLLFTSLVHLLMDQTPGGSAYLMSISYVELYGIEKHATPLAFIKNYNMIFYKLHKK